MAIPIHRGRPQNIPKNYRGKVRYRMKNHTQVDRDIQADFPTTQAILQTIGRITGSLESLSAVRTFGQLTMVITSQSVSMTGEFTSYDPDTEKALFQVLRQVDGTSSSLRREFAPCIEQIKITFNQQCECSPV